MKQVSNVTEVALVREPLLNLKNAVIKLLKEFPENIVLLTICKVVDR